MKKIILFSFILFSVFANAQSNYQRKLFQTPVAGTVSEVIYSNEYNTTTYVVENLSGSSPYTGYATLTKFTTTTGNVTSSRSFSISGYDVAIKQVIKKNHIIFMVASLTNSAGTTGMIVKYNLSTNATSWRRTVAISASPYTLNSITYDNGLYLYALGTCSVNNPSSDLFVAKLDTNGTAVWFKTLGSSTGQHIASNIVYNGKRELYVTSTTTLNTTSNAITLRLDSSATVLSSNAIVTNVGGGFRANRSAILKGKLVTVDQTVNMSNGDTGPFLIRSLDTNLTAISSKTLDGMDVKQIYSNNVNLLVTGSAPTNLSLKGFRTIRLDTVLVISGSRYFKKIITSNHNTSASCYINSTNNSFHFFKPNGNDTLTYVRADFFEGVGCRDTAYAPTVPALSFTATAYTSSVSLISGTLTTITLLVATESYSSSTLCSALTTGIQSVSNSEFISLYPNPTNSVLNINSEAEFISSIMIRDVTGKEILAGKTNGQINVSFLEAGVYFISLYNESEQLVCIKKFVKE